MIILLSFVTGTVILSIYVLCRNEWVFKILLDFNYACYEFEKKLRIIYFENEGKQSHLLWVMDRDKIMGSYGTLLYGNMFSRKLLEIIILPKIYKIIMSSNIEEYLKFEEKDCLEWTLNK